MTKSKANIWVSMMGERISNKATCVITIVLLWTTMLPALAAEPLALDFNQPRVRRPIAMGVLNGGVLNGKALLCVANRDSGSISIINATEPDSASVTAEYTVGKRLSDMAIAEERGLILLTDEQTHELVACRYHEGNLQVETRLPVSHTPVSVVTTENDEFCLVASLWSHRLAVVDLQQLTERKGDVASAVVRTIALPFAPRGQLVLPGTSKVVVAAAFGGRLAVVDWQSGELASVREFPGHNIRGLVLDNQGENVLMTHQILNPLAHASFADVHWGSLITNAVRVVSVNTLLDADASLLQGGRLTRLGDVGQGAADPAGLVCTANQHCVITLAGTGDVILRDLNSGISKRIKTGRRPVAVTLNPEQTVAYVANMFSDTVTVIDIAASQIVGEISLGPMRELKSAERGEQHFFDAELSHDSWLSCHSCHTDGHTNELLADTLGDGSVNTPKRVLSLLGVGSTGRWAWNGQVSELQQQVEKSITTTMHGQLLDEQSAVDLVEYLNTLSPPPPVDLPPYAPAHSRAIERGSKIFHDSGCVRCHVPRLAYTSPGVFDVGLRDAAGTKEFNPPSLRGVGQRGAFFHDNRARHLADVFTTHAHQLEQRPLTKNELDDLLQFLRSL